MKNIVRKSVMKVVDSRIKSGEKEFQDGCRDIDDRHLAKLKELEIKRHYDKQRLLDGIVEGILPKNL